MKGDALDTTTSAGIPLAKRVADALTATRLVLALAILLLAIFAGHRPAGLLDAVFLLVLLGWTTDMFDGRLARKSASPKTFIGEADLAVDLTLDVAALVFFAASGYVPWVWAASYLGFAALLLLIWTNVTLTSILELPVLAAHPVLAFVFSRYMGWLFVAWMGMAMIVNWSRMWEWIHLYLAGLKNVLRRMAGKPVSGEDDSAV